MHGVKVFQVVNYELHVRFTKLQNPIWSGHHRNKTIKNMYKYTKNTSYISFIDYYEFGVKLEKFLIAKQMWTL